MNLALAVPYQSARSQQGFTLLEVLATVVILSVGLLATARMQVVAIGANNAPIDSQEFSSIAREALESFASTGDDPSGTVDGFRVDADVENCTYGTPVGEDLDCGAVATPQLFRYTITVANNNTGESLTVSTLRFVPPGP